MILNALGMRRDDVIKRVMWTFRLASKSIPHVSPILEWEIFRAMSVYKRRKWILNGTFGE